MAHALTSSESRSTSAAAKPSALGAQLHGLHRALRVALAEGEGERDAQWWAHIDLLARHTVTLLDADRDALLYLLGQDAQRALESFNSRHALFSAVVSLVCAAQLAWPDDELALLARAALTMNLSMTALQDELSFRDRTLTVDQRSQIRTHPARSAELLRSAGCTDAVLLEVVERHHQDPPAGVALTEMSKACRVAALLRRADVFTAKVSARKTRPGLPPTAAARDACLGIDGRPDELGMVMIKTLGIYPPGSYVKLVTGELAVVSRRGRSANAPQVFGLVGADGKSLAEPIARDTSQAAHAIKTVLRPIDSRAIADHLRAGTLSG